MGVSKQSGQRFYHFECIINQLATTYNVYYLADPFRWENLIGIIWAETHTKGPICALVFSEYVLSIEVNGLGAKSQILSSVAPPRKKKLVTIFSQEHVWGPQKPMFY